MRIMFASIFMLACSSSSQDVSYEGSDTLVAYYNENCLCCENYFRNLEEKGFTIKRVKLELDELNRKKNELAIPINKRSCHTMLIGGKFVEGHVPAEAIEKLRNTKDARGVFSPHGFLSSMGMEEESYQLIR